VLGAIAGDIIGSPYEDRNIRTTEFPLFDAESMATDDSVLTVAVADSILRQCDYVQNLKDWHNRYPGAGYGWHFMLWAASPSREPYNSWGNGSAMRVSPVGFACSTLDETLDRAKRSAEVTHNHPEGIKGAQAVAASIFLARTGHSKVDLRDYVTATFGYDLSESIDAIRRHYTFDVSCQGSVPVAIRAFLESEDYEDAVRQAISVGGDSDTIACMTGGIAQAFYGGVPPAIADRVWEFLDEPLARVTRAFCREYACF
jgi:ADP-ribosylglycohydrolase